jgi:O-antigen/teichoic acid export membrane protein
MGNDAAPRTSTERHLTHIARGGAIGLVGAVVSAVSGFLLVLVVTNKFPSHVAGMFFTENSAFLLLASMSTLGAETGLGRFLLRHEAGGRRADIAATIRTAFRPTIAFSVVLAIGLVVFAGPLAHLMGLDGHNAAAGLRLLAILLPFVALNTLALAGIRAFGRIRPTVVVDQISRPLAQPLLILVVSVAGAGLLTLTLVWSLPYFVAALVSLLMFQRFLRRRGALKDDGSSADHRAVRRAFWSFTWPRSITRIAQMAIQRLDIILIAAMRSPTEAAIYTAATRFVALGQFGTQAIQQVLQPKFTALLIEGDHRTLRDVYRIAAAWSMAISWPLYVIVGCAPMAYLGLFGPEYRAMGVPVVLWMAAAMLFAVATGAADTLLLMSGRSGFSLVNNLAALALDVGLCIVLIPRMGIAGAALAWAVAVIARNTLSLMQTRITMSVRSFGRAAAIIAAANAVCLAGPLLLLDLIDDLTIVTLLITLVFALPAYAFVLWLGRGPLMLSVLRGLVRHGTHTVSRSDA